MANDQEDVHDVDIHYLPDEHGDPSRDIMQNLYELLSSYPLRIRLRNDFILPNLSATPGYKVAGGLAMVSGTLYEYTGSAWRKVGSSTSQTLFDHYASVGNVGTGEDDLFSDTIAAAQLANNGEKIEAEYGGVFVSSGTASRRIRIYFGGTLIFDSGALTLSLSAAWTIYVTVIRVSATVVRCMISMTTEGAALAAYTAYTEVTGLTLTNTQIIKITGEAAGVGAATDDIVAKMGTVGWRAAA